MKFATIAFAAAAIVLAAAPVSAGGVTGGKSGGVWAGTPGVTGFRSDSEMRALMAPGMVSPDAAGPLTRAYNALQKKDWAGAIKNCQQAAALANLAPFDKFMIDYFFGLAYYHAGDKASAADHYFAAASSTAAPADLRNDAILSAVQLANDAGHKEQAIALVDMADKAGIASEKIYGIAAVASFDKGDFEATEAWARKAIAAGEKNGGEASHISWQMLLLAQSRRQDYDGELASLDKMCGLFGDKQDWGNLIDIVFVRLPNAKVKGGLEVAAFYLYRLRLVTGATSSADDYVMAGQLALGMGSPGDAKKAIDAGTAAGVLMGNKDAATILAQAQKRADADQSVLAKAEALATSAKTGDAAVSVGEGYFGYGRYADAARMANAALSKGGRKTSEAKLLLGAAEIMTGDNASGKATLAAVADGSPMVAAAHLWSIYAGRKYGAAAGSQ